MTKTKLKKLMDQYCIVPSELDDVFAFVSDLLYLQAKELEENEPYATRSITQLHNAAHEVDGLIDYIDELEDE